MFAFNNNQFHNIDFVFCDINKNRQKTILFILNELHNILTNFVDEEQNNFSNDTSSIEFRFTLFVDKTEYVLFYISKKKVT